MKRGARHQQKNCSIPTFWRIEMTNAAVLPVPDWACIMRLRPIRSGMMARCWMGDGFSKLNSISHQPRKPAHLVVDRVLTHRHKPLWAGFPSVPFYQNWRGLSVLIGYSQGKNEKYRLVSELVPIRLELNLMISLIFLEVWLFRYAG